MLVKKLSLAVLSIAFMAGTFSPPPALAENWTLLNNNIYNNNSGNVGVGTSSPTSLLHSYLNSVGLNNYLTIQNGQAARQSALRFLTGTANADWIEYIPGSSTDLRFYRGADKVTFQAGGNVGIGTTNPTAKLSVNGTIQSTGSSGNVTTESIIGTGWYPTTAVTFPYTFSAAPNVVVTHNNSGTGNITIDKYNVVSVTATGFNISFYVGAVTTGGTTKFNWLAIQ